MKGRKELQFLTGVKFGMCEDAESTKGPGGKRKECHSFTMLARKDPISEMQISNLGKLTGENLV